MNMEDRNPDLERMVSDQIAARGVRDERVLAALRRVPRWEFVPDAVRGAATEDRPLPIGCGQTISQPYIVGLMTELLRLKGDEKVLEVGTGSGYQAAVLSLLAKNVHSLEFVTDLARAAEERLSILGYGNVHVHSGDGSLGLPSFAPYDGILVTAACPTVPLALLAQLAEGGRLVLPIGSQGGQMLTLIEKHAENLDREDILPVAFVPLRGQHGWKPEEW